MKICFITQHPPPAKPLPVLRCRWWWCSEFAPLCPAKSCGRKEGSKEGCYCGWSTRKLSDRWQCFIGAILVFFFVFASFIREGEVVLLQDTAHTQQSSKFAHRFEGLVSVRKIWHTGTWRGMQSAMNVKKAGKLQLQNNRKLLTLPTTRLIVTSVRSYQGRHFAVAITSVDREPTT